MASKIDIVSEALILIGESPISSFEEGGASGIAASNLYDTTRDALLTDTYWRFATGKKQLSRLTATPLNEWSYGYSLPSDLLQMIRMYPHENYQLYEGNLYTNASSVEIDYIYRPEPGQFPAYFRELLSYQLAAKFALTVANNKTLAELMVIEARDRQAKALFKDAQGRPNVAIQNRPWITARQ